MHLAVSVDLSANTYTRVHYNFLLGKKPVVAMVPSNPLKHGIN